MRRVHSIAEFRGAAHDMVMSPDGLMRQVLAQAETLAAKVWPVLLQGETGTGKDLIARVVHGGRGPFVVIDCTHLNPQLAESELFGSTRGAYTGADAERLGLIDGANGGCAFFDEIGELSLELQAKLLRLLQEKTYRRVGSIRPISSDFRIVAATNRDLKMEVAAGRFRQDLYYRLNVAKIKIPPLRERKEDIPLLSAYFSSRAGIRLPEEVLKRFMRHDWPGNVRELENSVYRIAARSTGERLDLPSTFHNHSVRVPPTAKEGAISFSPSMDEDDRNRVLTTSPVQVDAETIRPSANRPSPAEPTDQHWRQLPLITLENLERLAILRALHETQGDRSRAALILGISRATLYRKLQQFEQEPEFREVVQNSVSERICEKLG